MSISIALVLQMEDNVDPASAAKAMSTLPRVTRVMSIVDNKPFEIWREGQHIASDTEHPRVKAAMAAQEAAMRLSEDHA